MAAITILTPQELAERTRERKGPGGRRARGASEKTLRSIEAYKAELLATEPGTSADVILAPGEKKVRVREHLRAAAAEVDRALVFKQVRDHTRLHFRVVTPEEYATLPKRRDRRSNSPALADDVPQPSLLVEDCAA